MSLWEINVVNLWRYFFLFKFCFLLKLYSHAFGFFGRNFQASRPCINHISYQALFAPVENNFRLKHVVYSVTPVLKKITYFLHIYLVSYWEYSDFNPTLYKHLYLSDHYVSLIRTIMARWTIQTPIF